MTVNNNQCDISVTSPVFLSEIRLEAPNHGSVAMEDLMGELVSTLTSDLQTNLSLTTPPQLENTPPAGQVIHTHTDTLPSCY